MLLFEPVGEFGDNWPSPRLSYLHHIGIGELLTKLIAFVFDLTLNGIQSADESQCFDRSRIARLGLDKISSRMHPAAQMPNVVVDRIVTVIRVGVDEAAETFEEPLRKRLASAGGEVEEGVRVLRVSEVDPGVSGPSRPQEHERRIVGVDRER